MWDGFLIAKAVRTVPQNYSRPLPYPRVEKALRGTIYDSYIRRILWEGLLNPWAEDTADWLSCPVPSEDAPIAPSGLLGAWQNAYSATRKLVQVLLRDGVDITPDGPTVCPYHWAQPTHALNCEIVWPPALDEPPYNVRFDTGGHDHAHVHGDEEEDTTELNGAQLLDLDTPQYAGVIEKTMLIEKLLAQGGIRLAGVLNYLFAHEGSRNLDLGLFLVDLDAKRR